MRAALAGLDEGTFTEGHELDRKTAKQVPKAMIGRRLSQEEAKRLLAKFGLSARRVWRYGRVDPCPGGPCTSNLVPKSATSDSVKVLAVPVAVFGATPLQ
jgi:hypothetical protein